MTRPSLFIAAALAVFAASALAHSDAPFDVRASMQQRINPAILGIWDVTNNAMDDEGGLDPAQMDDAKWALIAEAADELAAASRDMAGAHHFIAAAADNFEVGEGEIPMADVQRFIDADPRTMGLMASALATHSDKLAAAARAKDAAATGDLVAEMDAVCESCHARYWYPE